MKKFWAYLLFAAAGLLTLAAIGAIANGKGPSDTYAGIFAVVLAICFVLWGARLLDFGWALKVPNKGIWAVTITAFVITAIAMPQGDDSQKQPVAVKTIIKPPPVAVSAPQSKGFDKLETAFLRALRDLDIAPKVEMRGDSKFYSTEYASLFIQNYPSTDMATAMMIPSSDEPTENLKSFGLVGAYVKAVVHEDAAGELVKVMNRSIKKRQDQSFTSNGYKITVSPPAKDEGMPMIAIEVKKI